MAYTIKKVHVKGFLSGKNVTLELDDKINFFIGRNGTGKTSFIRLVHAALSIDTIELHEINFQEIAITFQDLEGGKSPQLKIRKVSRQRAIFDIQFRYSGVEKYKQYISKPESHPYFFDDDLTVGIVRRNRRAQRERKDPTVGDLRRSFGKNLQMSWLPLMRYRGRVSHYYDPEDGEAITVEPINSKLSDLNTQMTRYFSLLESKAAAASKKFQRDYFLSLLGYKAEGILNLHEELDKNNLESEEKVIREIFNELEFELSEYDEQVTSHFSSVLEALERTSDSEVRIKIGDLFSIADTMRLHKIVERWKQYESEKNEIFRPKTDFAELMNQLLINKEFRFDDSNQPRIYGVSDQERIPVENLSSGEKQMFIMMAETLLQEKKEFVFLADEPELSLHIDWQESLVRNIRKMNENCQIIFATHSPDVVSVYQDNVFDFEKI